MLICISINNHIYNDSKVALRFSSTDTCKSGSAVAPLSEICDHNTTFTEKSIRGETLKLKGRY